MLTQTAFGCGEQSMVARKYLLELLLKSRGQVFGNTQRLYRDVDRCYSGCIFSSHTVFSNTFLHSDVVRILAEEVRLNERRR